MLSPNQRHYLLDIARRSIAHGLTYHRPLAIEDKDIPDELRRMAATFVTLEIDGTLRGCIGTLEARRPLVEDVAENAYTAAFHDLRFPPLTADELPLLEIRISVLSEPKETVVRSEAELLAKLRPGVDGLVLQDGVRRVTFLPSVWQALPDPRRFVEQLKQKAGWRRGHWSREMKVFLYQTEQFGEG